jgi:hypothetical protein
MELQVLHYVHVPDGNYWNFKCSEHSEDHDILEDFDPHVPIYINRTLRAPMRSEMLQSPLVSLRSNENDDRPEF